MRPLGIAVLTIGYPVLIYLALDHVQPRYLALLVLAAVILRGRWSGFGLPAAGAGFKGLALIGGGLLLAASFLNDRVLLLSYPIAVSAVFLGVFGHSLVHPPTVVERLARIREPDLPARGVAYTRKVTWVWCFFFLGNGLVSAATVWHGDVALWTLYNGLIAYVVMGLLFAGEWMIRSRVRKAF